jgi:alpha-glucosidase
MTQSGFNRDLPWWERGVVYQIYPRSFKDTSGNGVGDLQGVVEKLDYLNDGNPNSDTSLGVDAIWLSPFYPSPMADFGYDVADYTDVNELFGDLETFDLLLSEAHRRGIKIIIDYVPNHSSNQHAWFLESRASRDNPKRDWYIWRDAKPDGSPPNNWGSVFGGPAWTWDEGTDQFYFHQFLKEQPDLNWRNPEVRQAMFDVLRFWLDRGVDGFRMDVVGMIMKDPEMRDNPPDPNADPDLPENDLFKRNLHVYNEDQDEVHQILREFRKILDEYGDRIGIGEIWYELPRWVKYFGEKGDGLHMPFNFRLLGLAWDSATFRRSVDELDAAVPDFGWPNYVLGNHDRRRLASRLGSEQARVAAMLLLTLRGTPTLYYGDELGLENGIITPEIIQDPQGINLGIENTRDQERTPMQWNSESHAGFSTVNPWLPVSPDYEQRNVVVQNDDPNSMLNLYRRMLKYRRNTPALEGGTYQSFDVEHQDCFVYLRAHPEGSRIIALNFTGRPKTLSVPYGDRGRVALSTYLDRTEEVSLSELSLRPHEGIIIEVSE